MVICVTKICLNCKKEFSPSYSISKIRWEEERLFCTLKCHHIHRGKQNRKKLAPKVIDFSVNQGLSNVKIAEELKMSKPLVARILKENGIIYDENYFTRYPEKSRLFGKKRSLEERKNLSKSLRESTKNKGKNHWNWQGGISGERECIMSTAAYKEWRIKVFERDNYTCQNCGSRGGDLEVHHKKPWRDYPDLRFIVSNGQTLCVVCHKIIDKYRN